MHQNASNCIKSRMAWWHSSYTNVNTPPTPPKLTCVKVHKGSKLRSIKNVWAGANPTPPDLTGMKKTKSGFRSVKKNNISCFELLLGKFRAGVATTVLCFRKFPPTYPTSAVAKRCKTRRTRWNRARRAIALVFHEHARPCQVKQWNKNKHTFHVKIARSNHKSLQHIFAINFRIFCVQFELAPEVCSA